MNEMVNMTWNMAEWMGGKHKPVDILWLYAGWINGSPMFNIVAYVFDRVGLLNW